MTLPYDIHIVSLTQRTEEGPFVENVPGIWVSTRARRAARHRQDDALLLYLQLEGSLSLSPEKHSQLLERLGEVYYKTSGTVSGALRVVADSLNHFLAERNSRGGGGENSVVGHLTQMVLRGDHLFLAQSGLIQAVWIGAEGTTLLFDPELAGQGLGLSKTAAVRFYQTQFKAGDTLLLSLHPPRAWQPSLLDNLRGQGPQSWRRKLSLIQENETEAVLIQIQNGTGKVIFPPLAAASPPPAPAPSPVPTPQAAVPPAPREVAPQETPLSSEELPQEKAAEPDSEPPAPSVSAMPAEASPFTGESAAGRQTQPLPSAPPVEEPRFTTVVRPALSKTEKAGQRKAFAQAVQKIATGIATGAKRLLPDESVFQLPTTVMALIAVLVPLVVVTFASLVYFRQGRLGEYELYFRQAQQYAQVAQTQADPQAQRESWQAVIANLDRAEEYASTAETQALRAQAQVALDYMDGIKRLDFMPAVQGDLPPDAQIVKMIATEDELFMLDATSGVVWRAQAAARGYVVQPDNSCGPGIGGVEVSRLVGFAVEKRINQLPSVILAADSNGMVITCQADKPPQVEKLKPADTGMGALTGFTVDRGNYYALDPQKNAVWIYWGGKLDKTPELYFSHDVPAMKDVLDFAIYQDDLYLLYTDGHLAQCTYNAVTPTRCTDPQPYKDSRPGKENQPMVLTNPFSRVFTSQQPDPALYFLDPRTPAIFQFSLRSLAYHAQYHQTPLPTYTRLPEGQLASALAVSNDHSLAFIAFGNQVYYASLP